MRDDNGRRSGWRAGWQAPGTSTLRRALAALAALGLIALLTVCVYSAVVPALTSALALSSLAATGAAPAPRGPISTIPAGTAANEGTATPATADWYAFRTVDGGFQMDVPGVLGSYHDYFINDFSGLGDDFSYTGSPLSSPLQRREAQTEVSILSSTKITTRNICPQGGAAIRIGSGGKQVPAWERDEGRTVAVNLVLNGVAIEITLHNRSDAQPVLALYNDIWQHMLTSFAPLPDQAPGATHPCG